MGRGTVNFLTAAAQFAKSVAEAAAEQSREANNTSKPQAGQQDGQLRETGHAIEPGPESTDALPASRADNKSSPASSRAAWGTAATLRGSYVAVKKTFRGTVAAASWVNNRLAQRSDESPK